VISPISKKVLIDPAAGINSLINASAGHLKILFQQ